MKSKIEFALWNFMPEVNSASLRRICRSLTLHCLRLVTNRPLSVIEDYSLFRILLEAERRNSLWCVVIAPGSVLKGGFLKEVEKLIKEAPADAAIFGHLLDRKDRGFGLHEQMLVVNIPHWVKMGRPTFGRPQKNKLMLQNTSRSTENIHDDYTPLWLKSTEGQHEQVPKVMGWNLLDAATKSGLSAYNFTESLRATKTFLYPEQNPSDLLQFFDRIADQTMDLEKMNFSETQKEILRELHIEGLSGLEKIFLYNTESCYDDPFSVPQKPLDALFSLASGFKDLSILRHHGLHNQTELFYYDISKPALDYKKFLHENWDGKNYPDFLFSVLDNPPTGMNMNWLSIEREKVEELNTRWQNEMKMWKSPEHFQETFLEVKKLKRSYLHLNVYEQGHELVQKISQFSNKNVAFWYSNLFNFTPTLAFANWDIEELDQKAIQFLMNLELTSQNKNIHLNCYGEDVIHGCKPLRPSDSFGGLFD